MLAQKRARRKTPLALVVLLNVLCAIYALRLVVESVRGVERILPASR